jgi:hypothetical protein
VRSDESHVLLDRLRGKERGGAARWGRPASLLGLLLVALLLLLVVAQLVLPRLAAKVLRDRVARYGQVHSASVSAVPAIELLWGSAQSASVSAGRLAITPTELVHLLMQSRPVTDLTVKAQQVTLLHPGLGAGAVTLSHAVLRKRGEEVDASARLSSTALAAALPEGVQVSLLPGAGGAPRVRAGGQLFGFRASIEAAVEAVEGKVVLVPTAALLAGLGRITLFSNPKLQVQSVSAVEAGGHESQQTWTLSLRALLR